MAKSKKLSDIERDALDETANVGAGNASMALSDLMDKKVNLVLNGVSLISTDSIEKVVDGPKNLVVGVYAPISKDISGSMVIVFKKDSAFNMVNAIQGKKGKRDTVLTKDDEKELKTVGKIISDSYIQSLNQLLDLKMDFGDLNVLSTFGDSIIDIIMLGVDPDHKGALYMNTAFSVDKTDIEGEFILILAVKSLDTVLKKIRSKL